ncbi:MAG TPA: transketolase [Burkholderiaceae bacterium]|nr:transketolase [Burkholderiaceae bacterium]HQR69438.1 transketolase [Burkholderiaceae bacterium]
MNDSSPLRAIPASVRSEMANAIRALAMDAVQKANSGHPGMPMGMAEIAVALWGGHLKHNPANPRWLNRDRFVLSNGHGSMLQFALLHLTGYDLPMAEIERFRQMGSRTPGHPEYGVTPGIETTTGPLGQGLANAVGMALTEKLLAAEFNRPGHAIIDHRTYVFVGDGCLMEGISHEAASLAGTWRLNKLIAVYDDNGISIDGDVEGWFNEDTRSRFEAYGWNVIGPLDGHDPEAIDSAITTAKAEPDRPTLIIARTVIGKGSPGRAGSEKAHGEALGEAEIAATRNSIGWPHAPFTVPHGARAAWDATARGAALEAAWNEQFRAYAKAYPGEAAELQRRIAGQLPVGYFAAVKAALAAAEARRESVATRKASQLALEALAPTLPELLGGSADLTGSNLTRWSTAKALRPDALHGRHINYGVREFGMCAVANGIALYGGYIPFVGTFLVFSDYARNAVRMSALMKQRVIFVFTHDSIGLGEDGPTHQAVEHAASLRLIPNLDVWRPADTVETLVAWAAALERRDGPSVLLLSRQSVPFVAGVRDVADIRRGAYVASEAKGGARRAQAVLIATGSELPLAVEAQTALAAAGVAVRVVSMPSTTVFDRQSTAYKTSVLPAGIPRVAIEAGVTDFWWKYVRAEGAVIGIDRFGESAPAGVLFRHFGFTVDNVVATVSAVIAGGRRK